MEKLTHWKKLKNPDYLGSWDFQPDEVKLLTIKSVGIEKVKGSDGKAEDCSVCHFVEGTKPLILNSTNSKTITKVLKTPYVEKWIGNKILVKIESIKAFGDWVDAVRVVAQLPKVELQDLNPSHPKWAGAKKALAEGNVTVESIKKAYKLTAENEKLLCSN